MAHVTGPVSTLPGSRRNPPAGTMCDDHPDAPAVARIQGETDSMGAEYADFCEACVAERQKHLSEERVGVCEWCKVESNDLRHRRDVDEGLSGRVYLVCGECVRKDNARLRAEIEADGDDVGGWL